MKFMIQYPVSSTASEGAWLLPENVSRFARTAESVGFDAIGFTDHPAPSAKWLARGGHEAFDPLVALSFCAARTRAIQLMTHLIVAAYRSPLLLAKAISSVDILSGGRSTFVLGTGYMRSEFAALGVRFEQRNELFDEAVDVLRGAWSSEVFSYHGNSLSAAAQSTLPAPFQKPYPPLWVGGNSGVALDRVANWGQGWAAMMGPISVSSSARTRAITGPSDLKLAISSLEVRLNTRGRRLDDIDIMCGGSASVIGRGASLGERIEALSDLQNIGVTWISTQITSGSFDRSLEELAIFGSEVIRQLA
jgi:probable F420-dependent oxidoreductase